MTTLYPKLNENSILYKVDSYKVAHWLQYPEGTEYVDSYLESRGGAFGYTVYVGGLLLIKKHLLGQVVTQKDIDEADEFYKLHFGRPLFNKAGWQYIVDRYNGYLPITIWSATEGLVVGGHNILMRVRNTDPNCFWLTNFLETLLVQTWYPITVATYSRECKKVILKYLRKTGNPDLIDFKLHDFGFRGVSSVETAGIGGLAHLVNFKGTDTVMALVYARNYYDSQMAGFSIPASEHSTITSWGREEEVEACRNMLEKYPDGLVACVSDSFDIYNSCSNIWGTILKEKILTRDGTLVIRPDSGYPPEVLNKVLLILWDKFGGEHNAKGYKVLNPKVRVIQGDGIDLEMIETILDSLEKNGWSTDNITFGSGGGLLQKHNRDTLKFAFKCSSITIVGVDRDVYKDPITDKGKQSKRGKLQLIKNEDGTFSTINETPTIKNELVKVFENGELLVDYNLESIRVLASQGL